MPPDKFALKITLIAEGKPYAKAAKTIENITRSELKRLDYAEVSKLLLEMIDHVTTDAEKDNDAA